MAKKEKRIQDIYNLTPMQNGMLFHHLAAGESNVYFEQTVFIISGQLDARLLEESFRTIILRHDVLRTVFRSDKLERPQQFVLKNRKFDLHVADISQSPAEEQHNLLEEYKAGDSEKGFDPARDMLMRTALFKTGANRYRLVWSLHHILMDGWCLGIIIGELMQVYMALKEGSTPSLNPVIPYRRYIDWLDKQDNDEGLTYWREYLMGFDRSTGLPGKTTSNEEQRGYELKEMSLDLEGTIVSALGRTAQKAGTTISTLFQTAWGILLQCYNNCNDVVYGMVVSGRPPEIDGVESIVGLFINTVPIRIRTDEQATFAHLLNRIREESGPSKRHEHISLAEIQTNSELKSNLFDHIMVFENFPVEENVKKAGSNKRLGFQIEDMDSFEQTSYDLNILINPGDTFTVKFSYNSLVYSSRSIEAAAGYFQHILQQVANNPLMKAADIQLLMDTQKKRLLHNFNDTSADYPDTFTIMEMVEKQARKTPDRMAVTFKNTHTTYGKLMDGVGQLAALLRTHGVTAGSLVAVTTERCTELPTCILAILAAGGAYLPISTNSPWERSKYILEDSGSRLVLAPTSLSRPWGVEEPQETDIICLEEIDLLKGDAPDTSTKYGITNHESPEDFHTSATGTHMQSDRSDSSRNPAYAIYTSGSTGQPKGVLVEQRSVINRLNWMQRAYPIGGNDVILQKTPVVFDVSVWELFWWAFQGAALHLLEMGGESNPEALVEAIGKHRITTMHFVPSMLTAFLAHIKDARVYHRLSGLRQVFASGEALGEHQVIDFNSLLYDTNGTKLINLYGPTEATVDVSYYNCSPLAETAGIPIGKPIDNIKLYILDRSQRVQPVGIPGELYISGDGLARGYLNRPQLTADSFVDNPFFPGEKMYRTGDLALWSENGNIEFLGRLDFQVKIRGFRIELGEIENHLMAIRGVKDAAVLASADRDGDKFLCAYIATEEELSINAVRDHLSTVLLDYMVPSFFILLDTLPLTPNGKLDRKALPAPGTNENDNEYAAPAGTVEKKLAEIWANVLKVDIDKIGRDTGFFKLGGHSLKANSLVSQIHREFDIKIPLPRLLNKPTIKNLAKYMKEAEKETYSRIQPTEKKDHYPLSSAQQRLYVQQQMDESNTNYNIPQVLDMDMDIHPPQLEEMFQRIIRRHESFRTYFNSLDHRVVQRIAPGVPFKMEYHVQGDGCDTDINQPYVLEVFTNFVRAFDLTVPPLLRVGLIKINARRHLLMLDMHHIIADGVSIEVLTEELAAMYLDSELPPLSIQYKDFASWQNSLFTSGKIKEQEDYWLHQFADLPSPLDLPSDKTRPRVKNFTGDSLEFTVDKDLTEQLKQVAEATDTTLFMVMLTVFYIVLFKYTRREDIVLGTPVTGRRHDDLHRLIGMVTNMLAVRAKPAPGTTFMEFLRQVREVILEAFENQDFQFNDLVKKLGLRVELDRNPLFDVVFAMQIQGEDDKLNQGLAKRDDVKISSYTAGQEKAQFDLILNGTESADGIALNLVYSTELFHRSTAEKMTTHYLEFLKQAVQNSEKVLKDFEISHRLTAVNTDMLLEDNNDFGF